MNKIRGIGALLCLSLLSLACIMPGVALLQGCSTVNRSAYVGETATRVTVETAMGLWNEAVKAGKTTIAQEQAVKAAYNKVRGSMIVLCDTGKAISAASSTNAVTAFEQGLSQAVGDYSQNKADLFSLLTSFGIKL